MDNILEKYLYNLCKEEYYISLIGVREEDNDIVLTLSIKDSIDAYGYIEKIDITGKDYIKCSHNFDFYSYDAMGVFDDHLFLWDINKDRYDLYYLTKPDNMLSFLGDLLLSHNMITNCQIPFGKYINNLNKEFYYDFSINVDFIENQPNGIFASGPEPIMKEYFYILDKYKMKPTLVKRNLYYQELGKSYKYRVLVFGNSYVIAKSFSITKRDGQNFI